MASELIQDISERLSDSANIKKIFSEPIEIEGKKIITVAKVSYGFGGGSGKNPNGSSEAEGSGGGGGVMAKPVGMIEITKDATKYIPFDDIKKFLGYLAGGIFVGWFIARKMRKRYY
jgi:uncharacterized spore protein YtfJ